MLEADNNSFQKTEYSISPDTGRVRKRVRIKKRRPLLSKRRIKKYIEYAVWIFLLLAFIASLIIIIPELNISSEKYKAPKGTGR